MAIKTILLWASKWNSTEKKASELTEKIITHGKCNKINEKIINNNEKILEHISESTGSTHVHYINGTVPEKYTNAHNEFVKLINEKIVFSAKHQYAIVGFGDKSYGNFNYCRPARELYKVLSNNNYKKYNTLITIDVSQVNNSKNHLNKFINKLLNLFELQLKTIDTYSNDSDNESTEFQFDLEDNVQDINSDAEMIDENQKRVLEKQKYAIVGSHSAVKLCRWTKNQLKGMGACYKHGFYGIQSHKCMEFTCCLACANRCVFCWRHHKNPVTTKWKYKIDDPIKIVEEAIRMHRVFINQQKSTKKVIEFGLFNDSLEIAHCALSLVGEPILYPRINELLEKLHESNISTFLVNNGQFVEQLEELTSVTQLYLSVDASDPQTMLQLDKPLFNDYWHRFLSSAKIIRNRKERTVFRLTVIKDANDSQASEYAKIISLGLPDFIELKGVTFSGVGCGIRMTDVPTHQNVREFSENINSSLAELYKKNEIEEEYDLACEHEHSCSVLIAKTKYRIEKKWYTHINFEKFFELKRNNSEINAMDYYAATPNWALYNSKEQGFDPMHNRAYTKGRLKLLQMEAKSCDNCTCL